MITLTVFAHWIFLAAFAVMPLFTTPEDITTSTGMLAMTTPRTFKATQRVWHKQNLIQTYFDICRQRWHFKGQKISIGRFNYVILFFGEALNRNHSLGLQFGFDFLFKNTVKVVVSVK